jgi:hypothetical protein
LNSKTNSFQLFNLQLETVRFFPKDWETQIAKVVRDYSTAQILDGSSATSREIDLAEPISIRIVDGSSIHTNLRWLFDLYCGELLKFAEKNFGKRLHIAQDLRSAVNLNIIEGRGRRYEWHVDSNPVTGLLFLSTLDERDGGALLFKQHSEEIRIYPKLGMFLCFDATEVPHTVEPLLREVVRISAPMNFYIDPKNQVRPKDLDEYLYQKNK